MNQDSNPDTSAPAETLSAQPRDFYRQHTFQNKGPGRRERRDYLQSRAIFLPTPKDRAGLSRHQIEDYFARVREERAKNGQG